MIIACEIDGCRCKTIHVLELSLLGLYGGMDVRTYVRTESSPCVLWDIVPFGATVPGRVLGSCLSSPVLAGEKVNKGEERNR